MDEHIRNVDFNYGVFLIANFSERLELNTVTQAHPSKIIFRLSQDPIRKTSSFVGVESWRSA